MEGIISAAARVAKVHLRNDDDLVDRLHHRYTVLFLVIFTAVVSTTQYVGDPISCWCPAYFTENHVDYTNKVLLHLSCQHFHYVELSANAHLSSSHRFLVAYSFVAIISLG